MIGSTCFENVIMPAGQDRWPVWSLEHFYFTSIWSFDHNRFWKSSYLSFVWDLIRLPCVSFPRCDEHSSPFTTIHYPRRLPTVFLIYKHDGLLKLKNKNKLCKYKHKMIKYLWYYNMQNKFLQIWNVSLSSRIFDIYRMIDWIKYVN